MKDVPVPCRSGSLGAASKKVTRRPGGTRERGRLGVPPPSRDGNGSTGSARPVARFTMASMLRIPSRFAQPLGQLINAPSAASAGGVARPECVQIVAQLNASLIAIQAQLQMVTQRCACPAGDPFANRSSRESGGTPPRTIPPGGYPSSSSIAYFVPQPTTLGNFKRCMCNYGNGPVPCAASNCGGCPAGCPASGANDCGPC